MFAIAVVFFNNISALGASHNIAKFVIQNIAFVAFGEFLKSFVKILHFKVVVGQKNGLRMVFNQLVQQSVSWLMVDLGYFNA